MSNRPKMWFLGKTTFFHWIFALDYQAKQKFKSNKKTKTLIKFQLLLLSQLNSQT